MSRQTEPTEDDIRTLARALDLEVRFGSGIFPRGGAQTSQYRKLCRYGMLEFTGEYGRDIDAMVDDDVPIYKLTEHGRAWIKAREDKAECDMQVIHIKTRLAELGIDVREPSSAQPGPDGEFVTVGVIEGVDEPLIEVDTSEQAQSWTLEQAKRLVGKLYDVYNEMPLEERRERAMHLLRGYW